MGRPANGRPGSVSSSTGSRKTAWNAHRRGSARSSRSRAAATCSTTASSRMMPVKWTRAVHHLTDLVEKCAEPPSPVFRFDVVELWVFGDLLGVPRDLDEIQVALVADLPVDEVPWLTEPVGAEHWANSTRMSRNPISAR